jgi:hypothetical protein
MWLAVIALAVGGVVGLAAGGRPRHLAGMRLRLPWVLVAGAGCELVGTWWVPDRVGLALLVVGYVLLVSFALANVRLAGMVLVAVGLLCNLVVIAVDGGMPVRGVPAGISDSPRHHGMRASDQLTPLADDLRLAPFGETVSAGDVVLSVGVATTVAGALVRGRRRRSGDPTKRISRYLLP